MGMENAAVADLDLGPDVGERPDRDALADARAGFNDR